MLDTSQAPPMSAVAFDEQHFPVRYWARRWGFSEKTVREWFRDVYGPASCGSQIPAAGRSATTSRS